MPHRGFVQPAKPARAKCYCPFCDASEHYLSQCASFTQLTPDQVKTWIRRHDRCCRCARSHHASRCDLKKLCSLCRGLHLRPLHNVNVSPTSAEDPVTVEKSCLTSFSSDRFFCDKPFISSRVMLKVVTVHLHYEDFVPWIPLPSWMTDRSERSCFPLPLKLWAFRVFQKICHYGLSEMMFRSFEVVPYPSRFLASTNRRLVIRSVMPSLLIALTCHTSPILWSS